MSFIYKNYREDKEDITIYIALLLRGESSQLFFLSEIHLIKCYTVGMEYFRST